MKLLLLLLAILVLVAGLAFSLHWIILSSVLESRGLSGVEIAVRYYESLPGPVSTLVQQHPRTVTASFGLLLTADVFLLQYLRPKGKIVMQVIAVLLAAMNFLWAM